MGIKSALAGLTLAGGLVFTPQQSVEKPADPFFPKLVQAYRDNIQEVLDVENQDCASPLMSAQFRNSQGIQTIKLINHTRAPLPGVINSIVVRCEENPTPTRLGDATIPLSNAKNITLKGVTIQQSVYTYAMEDLPGVTILLQKHHGQVDFQKLTSLASAMHDLEKIGLRPELKRVSIYPMGDTQAYSEVSDQPDEIILSEEALHDFSKEELQIMIRHELFHLLDEQDVFAPLQEVFSQHMESLTPEQRAHFEQKINETHYYEIFHPDHKKKSAITDAHEYTEHFVRFLNTYGYTAIADGAFNGPQLIRTLERLLAEL